MYSALIVDDEESIREIIVDILSDAGEFTFDMAADGAEAYQKTCDQQYDLIFTDYKMPKINGSRFIRYVKSEENRNNSAHIFVMSGYIKEAQAEFEKLALENIYYFAKPFSRNLIKEKVIALFPKD